MVYFQDDEWKKKEKSKIDSKVFSFSQEMKEKMFKKVEEGFYGWDSSVNISVLKRKLKHHIKKGYDKKNLIDIANFCMMIYFLE